MHDEVGHDGVPGCVAAFEGVHVAGVVNALIEGLGGHVSFRVPKRADVERASALLSAGSRPVFEAEVTALLIEGLRQPLFKPWPRPEHIGDLLDALGFDAICFSFLGAGVTAVGFHQDVARSPVDEFDDVGSLCFGGIQLVVVPGCLQDASGAGVVGIEGEVGCHDAFLFCLPINLSGHALNKSLVG